MAAPPQPSHAEVHALLADDGEPSALLHAFPHFDANATAPGLGGWPYLHWACLENRFATVRGLLACGASLPLQWMPGGSFPLLFACIGGEESRAELMAWLLTEHADARETVNWSDRIGVTCLHRAAYHNNVALARVLLLHDADLTLECEGRTPAQHARQYGRIEVAEVLEAAERAHAGAFRGMRAEDGRVAQSRYGYGNRKQERKNAIH